MSKLSFTRADWLASTNIYEVNIRQYSAEGTFNAFAKELPRLKDMGVEALWFMPIHPIGIINRKGKMGSYYSIRDYKTTNPEFGTPNEFKSLITQAHQLGMKVIMDWVANHASWDNVWTIDHPEYFERDNAGNFKPPYDWTDVIQIDHSSIAEQDAMIDTMKFWVINFDIDGFRADLAHLTPLEFWRKARTAIEPIKPGLFWLAETEEISYHEVFDASFTWEWMHCTENYYKKQTGLGSLYHTLQKYENTFSASAHRMYFTSNHDENTWNGTEYEKYGDMAKALAVFSITWSGIPMIYSGQEMPNFKRLAFFEKDPIDWKGGYTLHDFYKTLLKLRKRNPALRSACSEARTRIIETSDEKSIMAYLRKNKNDEVLVFLNLSGKRTGFSIKDQFVKGNFVNVFTGVENHLAADTFIEIQPWNFLVYEKIVS